MATVRDIARRANVSIATVSRVLNNDSKVSESTRLLVLQVAQELDYEIPEPARKLIVSRSVLVLTRHNAEGDSTDRGIGDYFVRTAWLGVEEYFSKLDIIAKLQRTNFNVSEVEKITREAGVAGIIILGGIVPNEFLEKLLDSQIPFVLVGSDAKPLEANSVMSDVTDGIRQVVRFLVSRNRCRIGFVNGPDLTRTSTYKMDGYCLELALNQLPFDENKIVSADFTPESGYQSTAELIGRGVELDAVIFADDLIAIGGMKALREANYRIPEDISVIGFGGYDISQFTSPALTGVVVDMYKMGAVGAKRLSDLLKKPDDNAWSIIIPVRLEMGEST